MSVVDGGAIELASEKQKLLLAILALAPEQCASRSEVMSILWGDRGTDQARGSMRHALWAIRKELGDLATQVLQTDGQLLCLRNTEVDVADFEAAVATRDAPELDKALALYRGDLLQEFDLGGREGYDSLLIARERLRDVAVAAAKKLIGFKLAVSDADGAVAVAQTVLEIDPLQEDIHRQLITLYRDRGQTGLAVKQYEACREVLAELDVSPSDETQALRQSLSTGRPAPAEDQNAAPPVAETAHSGSRNFWIWGGAAAVLAATALAVGYTQLRDSSQIETKPHIAVLPFQDMSIDKQQVLYSEGLTADVITDLAKLSGIEVIAHDSVRAIWAADTSILEIADALNVGYVLRGNVRRSRGLVRINVQLIDAGTGHHVWAERFDRSTSELFEVQAEVVRHVAAALNVIVSDTEQAAVARIPTGNLEAYDQFLRAEHLALDSAGAENRRRKLAAYRKAIELDPDFADAYAGYSRALVDIWRLDMTDLMSSTVAKEEAYRIANEALRLDPESARALSALAMIQVSEGQHGAAVASARNAALLEPGNAAVQADLALVLALSGQPDAAREALALAHELNPAMPVDLLVSSGIVFFEDGRFDEALKFLEKALEQNPTKEWANVIALASYGHLGDTASASATTARLLEAFPIANLSYYQVARDQLRTPLQSARFIDGLKLAGLSEWPFAVNPADGPQISGEALEELVYGRTWIGDQASGTPFIQENSRTGVFAYRSDLSLRTGSITVDEDRVCETSDGNIPAGKSCGWLHETERDDADYLLVMPDSARFFRISP